MVICEVCKREFVRINSFHLRKHDITKNKLAKERGYKLIRILESIKINTFTDILNLLPV